MRSTDRRDEFALLRWKARCQRWNWLRWFVHKPAFWAMVLLYGVVGGFAALTFPGLPRLVPQNPMDTPFVEYWNYAAFLGIYVPFAAVFGMFPNITARPEIDIVFPTPLRRSSLKQIRILRTLLGVTFGSVAIGLLLGVGLSASFTLPFWREIPVAIAVVLPAVGVFVLGSALLIHGWHTLSDKTQTLVASTVAAGLFLWFVAFIFWERWYEDPMVNLYFALLIPPTKLVMGFPMDAIDIVEIALGWTAFLLLAVVAQSFPYQVFEDYGTSRMRTGGPLSRERGGGPPSVQRLRVRLRVSYKDLGPGARALVGRNLTLYLRGASLIMGVVVLVLTILFLGALLASGPVGVAGAFIVMLPTIMALALVPMFAPTPANEGAGVDMVRLLPLTPGQIWLGYLLPILTLQSGWATLSAILAAVGRMSLGFSVTLWVFVVSLGWVVTSATILVGVRTKPRASPGMEPAPNRPFNPWSLATMYPALFEVMAILVLSIDVVNMTAFISLTVVNVIVGVVAAVAGLNALSGPPRS